MPCLLGTLVCHQGVASVSVQNIKDFINLLLSNLTASGFLPGGSGTAVRHVSHKITQHTNNKNTLQ
jgi:hypothetical protein